MLQIRLESKSFLRITPETHTRQRILKQAYRLTSGCRQQEVLNTRACLLQARHMATIFSIGNVVLTDRQERWHCEERGLEAGN